MQLLNVSIARSTWLFDMADLNPKGKSLFPELITWLKDNYEFEGVPKSISDVDETKGLSFRQGSFQAQEEIFVDVHLTVYADGLLAQTNSSTKDADAFLKDVIDSLARDFSLSFDPTMIRDRIYLSELTVRLEHSLVKFNSVLAKFAERVTAACTVKNVRPFEFGGLSFCTDTSASVVKLAPFFVERKQNAPFDENRFFSRAPLRQEDHLRLLQEFDDLLAA